MPQIQLGYGSGSVNLNYDPSRFQLLAQDQTTARRMSDAEIGAAIDNPFEGPPLEELVSARDSVLIVASDATRATGSAQIINLLVRRLIQEGVDPGNVAIIFATGLHRHVRQLFLRTCPERLSASGGSATSCENPSAGSSTPKSLRQNESTSSITILTMPDNYYKSAQRNRVNRSK